jgi:hypothetical protein
MNKKIFFVLLMLIGVVNFAFAKKSIIIGSGGQNGNYYKIAQDIVEFCGDDIKKKFGYDLINQATNGSIENLNGLLNKKYSIGLVQEDVYEYFKRRDQLNVVQNNTIKLFYLYPEYVHILIPKGWKPKGNGLFSMFKGLFGSDKTISLSSLKGQTVYAMGGGIVSAKALSYFMGLNFKVVDAKGKKVDGPFIFVTGADDPRIQKMLNSGKWILLSFNGNELAARSRVYTPAQLTYTIGSNTITVNTVSVKSLVLARKYRGKKRREAIKEVKMCVKNNIDDMIDDGISNKWTIVQQINGWGESFKNDD